MRAYDWPWAHARDEQEDVEKLREQYASLNSNSDTFVSACLPSLPPAPAYSRIARWASARVFSLLSTRLLPLLRNLYPAPAYSLIARHARLKPES